MKRVLIPVDGSDSSLRAITTATQAVLERKTRPEVHLLTVQAPILSGNVTRFFTAEAINDFYQEEGHSALEMARQKLDAAGIEYSEHIQIGPAAQTITQYAEEHDCDHIIMGTRGLGAVTGMVLGSVANKVLGMSKVPVTLVP